MRSSDHLRSSIIPLRSVPTFLYNIDFGILHASRCLTVHSSWGGDSGHPARHASCSSWHKICNKIKMNCKSTSQSERIKVYYFRCIYSCLAMHLWTIALMNNCCPPHTPTFGSANSIGPSTTPIIWYFTSGLPLPWNFLFS